MTSVILCGNRGAYLSQEAYHGKSVLLTLLQHDIVVGNIAQALDNRRFLCMKCGDFFINSYLIKFSGFSEKIAPSLTMKLAGQPFFSWTTVCLSQGGFVVRSWGVLSFSFIRLSEKYYKRDGAPRLYLTFSYKTATIFFMRGRYACAGFDSPKYIGGQPPAARFFCCPKHASLNGRPCGRSKGLPVSYVPGLSTCTALPTLLTGGEQVQKPARRRHFMPKIFCSLFEGEPVRYIYLKHKKARRQWFFSEDVMSAIRTVRDDDFFPDACRMTTSLRITGTRDDIDLLSLEGVLLLVKEAEPKQAVRFLSFLATSGIMGGRPC